MLTSWGHINILTFYWNGNAPPTLFHFFETTDKYFELDIEFIAKNKIHFAMQSPELPSIGEVRIEYRRVDMGFPTRIHNSLIARKYSSSLNFDILILIQSIHEWMIQPDSTVIRLKFFIIFCRQWTKWIQLICRGENNATNESEKIWRRMLYEKRKS